MATRTATFGMALAALFLGIQVVRPARTNPAVDPSRTLQARVSVPPEVTAILTRACQDCHSNNTRWPWYSNLAPMSWLLVSDVNEGRRHMNFSEWDVRASSRHGADFPQICEEVRMGDMPLWFYLPLHPNARLSGSDVSAICTWASSAAKGATRGSH